MGKKTTKTEEKQHAVTQPNVPDWISNPYKDYMGRVQQFGAMDPNQFVPGASGLQQQAFGMSQGIMDRLGKRFHKAPPMQQAMQARPMGAMDPTGGAPAAPVQMQAPMQPQAPVVTPNPIDYQSYMSDPRVAAAYGLLYGNGNT